MRALRLFALPLLSLTSLAASDAMLDNSSNFRPSIIYLESLNEKVLTEITTTTTGGVSTQATKRTVVPRQKVNVQIVARMVGMTPEEVNEDTVVSVRVGAFSHSARVGDDGKWKKGKRRAGFEFVKSSTGTTTTPNTGGDNTDDEGDTPNPGTGGTTTTTTGASTTESEGSVRYGWSGDYFLVRIFGVNVGDVLVAKHKADPFKDADNANATRARTIFTEAPQVSVQFGQSSGSRLLHARGAVEQEKRRYLKADGTAEELIVHRALVTGDVDTQGPRGRIVATAKKGTIDNPNPTPDTPYIAVIAKVSDQSKINVESFNVDSVDFDLEDSDVVRVIQRAGEIEFRILDNTFVDAQPDSEKSYQVRIVLRDSSGNESLIQNKVLFKTGVAAANP